MKYVSVIFIFFCVGTTVLPARQVVLDSLPDPIASLNSGNKFFYTGSWWHSGGYSRSGDFSDHVIGDTTINSLTYAVLKRSRSLLSIFGPHNIGDMHGNAVFDSATYHYRRLSGHLLYEYDPSLNQDLLLIDYDADVGTDDPRYGYVGIKGTELVLTIPCLVIKTNIGGGTNYVIQKYASTFAWLGFSIDGSGVSGSIYLRGAVVDGSVYGDTSAPATSISNMSASPPTKPHLFHNYPNPFNSSTTISFTIPVYSFVSLRIYDVLGKEVAILVAEHLPAGFHQRSWTSADLPSGVYFYKLSVPPFQATNSLILLR